MHVIAYKNTNEDDDHLVAHPNIKFIQYFFSFSSVLGDMNYMAIRVYEYVIL